MGRIKTKLVKRLTRKLMDAHNEEFTTDFTQNKKLVKQWITESSLKIKNTIAGYVTRLKRAGYVKGYFQRPGPSPQSKEPRQRSTTGGGSDRGYGRNRF